MTATAVEAPEALRYDYDPHPKQAEAHGVLVDELLYGGAAGGGKSRMARAEAVSLALMVPGVRVVLFRRTFPDLQRSVEDEMKKEIPPGLGSYNHSKHMWSFANGSIIELAHLQREDDVYKYQGAEYALVVFEELTHFTEKQYLYLKSRLRVAGAVRKRMKELGLRPRMLATANPGGVGHHWVRKRFVDPVPAGTIFRTTPTSNEPRPGTRCYIPARVTDNPSVNPEYIDMLNALPETQRKALRDGDWDVLEGVRFKDWSAAHHVIRPEQLPMASFLNTGQKVIAVDYGVSSPFAALWMVKLSDDLIVVYREAYEKELTPTQQAELIRDLSADEEAQMGVKIPVVCDPSMWNRATAGSARSLDPNRPPAGSPAHAYMQVLGRTPLKAVNERVNGWALIDEHLRVRQDGLPRWLVYDTCRELIRTLPALPRDKKNPDDVDCFVAGTMISTPGGQTAVENLRVGDLVNTPMGPQPVIKADPEEQVQVSRIRFSNGQELVGTADHEVVTLNRGLVQLQDLERTDEIATQQHVESRGTWIRETGSFTGGTATADHLGGPTTSPRPGPRRRVENHFTGTSTETTMGKYQTVTTSTMLTMTPRTTTPAISCSWKAQNTPATTLLRAWTLSERPSATGLSQSKEFSSSGITWRRPAPHWHREKERARIVEALTTHQEGHLDSARVSANTRTGESAKTYAPAPSAEQSSAGSLREGTSHGPVPTSVDGNYGEETVYALTVDGCALYYANGMLVTNTTADDHLPDCARYGSQYLAGKRVLTAAERAEDSSAYAARPLSAGLRGVAF